MRSSLLLSMLLCAPACGLVLGLERGTDRDAAAGGASGGDAPTGGTTAEGGSGGEGGEGGAGGEVTCPESWGRSYSRGQLGGNDRQTPRDIAIAADGSALVVGDFFGRIQVGGQEFVAEGEDGFLASVRPNGSIAWLVSCTGPGPQETTAVTASPALQSAGLAGIAGGHFRTSLAIGNDNIIGDGEEELFLTAFDTRGVPAWTAAYHSSGAPGARAYMRDLAALPDGDVVAAVSYRFEQTLTSTKNGPMVTLPPHPGESAALIAVDPSNGQLRNLVQTFGGQGEDAVTLLTEGVGDTETTLVGVGEYNVSFDLGLGAVLTAQSPTRDAVLFGIDDNLTPSWYVDVKSNGRVYPGAVTVDASGLVHATFGVSEDVNVAAQPVVVSTPSVIYMRVRPPDDELEVVGTVEEIVVLSTMSSVGSEISVAGIAIDECGLPILAGDVNGDTDFDCGDAGGSVDVFFATISDGEVADCERFGNSSGDQFVEKAAFGGAEMIAVGTFEGGIDFGFPMSSLGAEDGFVVRAYHGDEER